MADDALLDDVRAAADAALEARVDGDGDPAAPHRALSAARAALDGGHAIAAIAKAEADGERAARERLGAQVLRVVERSARKLREATVEYEAAIVRAVSIGLAARDIAQRAGVSHGTVAAVARRHEQAPATASVAAEQDTVHGDGASEDRAAPPPD